jgi:hypothetical protein
MPRRQPTLSQLKQSVRAELCGSCPFRDPKRTGPALGAPLRCEATCPVFVHLPTFKAVGERLDPMVGSHERAVHNTIHRILEIEDAGSDNSPDRKKLAQLRYHRRRLARLLGRLLNP